MKLITDLQNAIMAEDEASTRLWGLQRQLVPLFNERVRVWNSMMEPLYKLYKRPFQKKRMVEGSNFHIDNVEITEEHVRVIFSFMSMGEYDQHWSTLPRKYLVCDNWISVMEIDKLAQEQEFINEGLTEARAEVAAAEQAEQAERAEYERLHKKYGPKETRPHGS